MIFLENVLLFMVVVTLVPVSAVFLQVFMALPTYRHSAMPAIRRPTVAILVPAHDEASGIADTLATIRRQLVMGDRLIVVADNCRDDTAAVACASGAEVIERKDEERRGKGYALDFAVRFLERNPPEVVIAIDADCLVSAEAIDRLSRFCVATARPAQSLYLMHSPAGAGLNTRIAEFAWLVKNMVRPLGFHRLGLPCQLMGTGMAFPWAAIRTTNLASGHIVEDLLLGVDLARSYLPPRFCPEAKVTSTFPTSSEGIQNQRTRWEHGHLGMVLNDAPRLFAEAVATGNWMLMALVIDLCVPPLALLTLLVLALFAVSTALFAATNIERPFWLAVVALALLGFSVFLSWYRYGRKVIPLSGFFHVPAYLLGKVPLYAKFLRSRQVEWVRSKREAR
jgi:cellulose synthase/poly-beta-1,6-N-acetylglucosamine synthase-like glycosyltransferase